MPKTFKNEKVLCNYLEASVFLKIMRYKSTDLALANEKNASSFSHYLKYRGLTNFYLKSIWTMRGAALDKCDLSDVTLPLRIKECGVNATPQSLYNTYR